MICLAVAAASLGGARQTAEDRTFETETPSTCVYSILFISTLYVVMTNDVTIRAVTASDIDQICQIDTDASSKFASIPALADLADGSHGPLEFSTVQHWLASGTVYAAEDEKDMLGFTAVQPKDGILYIAELSVREIHQGRGLGTLLLEKVFKHARQTSESIGSSVAKVSLTTYPDVPWNGPWYQKRGFEEVSAETLGSWHVQKVQQDDEELARPGYRRCCMLREEAFGSTARA